MKNFNGKILFLDRSDINTDEIIPAKYLTELTKEALKPYCLEDLSLESFDPKRDIAGKSVIVTRTNFGCGSSREHAPWALMGFGFRAVIAPSFADIFYNNSLGNGLLPLKLTADEVDQIFKVLNEKPGTKITISLEDMTVECDSLNFKFDLDPFRRHCMLEGLDAISLTMQHEKEISDYEKAMPSWRAKGTF